MNWSALLIFCLGTSVSLSQSAEGFIYGTVHLKNGEKRVGQLRWENEEALWEDIFDAYKASPPVLDGIDYQQARDISSTSESFDLGFMNLWEDRSPDLQYAFKVRFGDIMSLKVRSDKRADLTLRNGEVIELKDGASADINREIVLFDPQLGQLDLPWSELESIEFNPAPDGLTSAVGRPLYGRLITTNGLLEGYVTWDMEECVERDFLGGKDNGINTEIEFGKVDKIQADGDGSLVTLKNGQEIFLNKHPDVSSSNRGIQIKTRDRGIIRVDWEHFISIDFMPAQYQPSRYETFRLPKLLEGSVFTSDGAYNGRILYDLDETWDVEVLDGSNAGYYYYLPFYLIRLIAPQNYQFSQVELKSGKVLVLGNHGDVSNGNNGLLVFPQDGPPKYIPWPNVKQVRIGLESN